MKKNKLIKSIVPYNNVKFKFIEDHYDIHLKGTCYYKNELCSFVTLSNSFKKNYNNPLCEITFLSRKEKIRKIFKQKIFELFVGTHWTYKNGKRTPNFGERKPKFFWNFMFRFYYNFYQQNRRK